VDAWVCGCVSCVVVHDAEPDPLGDHGHTFSSLCSPCCCALQVTTGNGSGDGVVDVFSGPSASSLAWLAGARHGGNTSFVAAPGLVYFVRVEGVGNSSGPVSLTVNCAGCRPLPSSTPSPGPEPHCSRVPAIISVTSTLVSTLAVVVNMGLQVGLGVTEALVGVAGVGLDYGGVGGGVLGFDVGLLEVCVCVRVCVRVRVVAGSRFRSRGAAVPLHCQWSPRWGRHCWTGR
jgi:hypothetical protein